jgi:hypothetical protein
LLEDDNIKKRTCHGVKEKTWHHGMVAVSSGINVAVFCNNAMSIAKTQLWFLLYLLEFAFKH